MVIIFQYRYEKYKDNLTIAMKKYEYEKYEYNF